MFKAKQIHYKKIEVFTKDLTLNLMLSLVVTYQHDHMQTPNPRTPSFLGFTAMQAPLFVTLRSYSKFSNTNSLVCDSKTTLEGLNHQLLLILL